MLHELKSLRKVAGCEEHIDFSILRQKILVCLANAPSVERLLAKFSRLHASWTQSRAKMFSVRNQAGIYFFTGEIVSILVFFKST